MTTNNQGFITDERLKKVLKNGFRKICKLDYPEEVETIALSFIKPIEMMLPMIIFMSEWVEAVEKKLSKIEKHTELYADWLSIRGFTYDEFRWVLETAYSEEKFDRVAVYGFLYLDDSISVEEFKVRYGDPDISMRSRYLQALSDITKIEIPVLYDFLCESKMTLRYPVQALVKHCYMLAQSSSGKSEFIKHVFHELCKLLRKVSLVLIEPHMDLSLEIIGLRNTWKKGLKNVIYLDPDIVSTASQMTGNHELEDEYIFSLNPFDTIDSNANEISFLVENLSSAFFSVINSDETFQMEAIIEACIETLLIRPDSDILDLKRFMDDNQNSDLVEFAIANLKGERLDLMKNRFLKDPKIQQTKSSIYYRLLSILGKDSLVQCLVGRRTVDLESHMNDGKTIICNFSKAILGPTGAQILGKIFVALISGYATLRQKQPKSKRMETYIFMDEFHNYINTGSTEELFAEQRKYKTYFFVANQQMGQSMSSEIKRLVAGNTALHFMGPNESESIEWFSKQFKKLPENPTDNLPKYSFWFSDKYNKNLGSFIIRSPSYLVDHSNTYHLNESELRIVFNYLIKESGIYRVNRKNYVEVNKSSNGSVLEHNFSE